MVYSCHPILITTLGGGKEKVEHNKKTKYIVITSPNPNAFANHHFEVALQK